MRDVVELFCALVAIPSPSGRERAVGTWVADRLLEAGVDARFDDAGEPCGSDAGNLVAVVPGERAAPTLLFLAHLDTVESGAVPIEPMLGADGVIRSAGETILGADNKSAVAATMRLCGWAATLDPVARPTIVAAFTCREESGRMGASQLDLSGLAIDVAFSVDGSRPVGTAITRALGQRVFTVEIAGRASHAAAAPEAGVSAIAVAAEAVAAMPLGRLPGGGSASVAAIVGGGVVDHLGGGAAGVDAVRAALAATPTNSVPALTLLRGEVRAYRAEELEAAARELEAAVAAACAAHGANYAWRERRPGIPPFPGAPDSRARALARSATARLTGVTFTETEAQATLEANYLAAAGLDVVALASGGQDPHQPSESIGADELRTLEALLRAIVEEAVAERRGLRGAPTG